MVPVWILTFNRPKTLNNLIISLGKQGLKSNILSNHPVLELVDEAKQYVDDVVINSLNCAESNSWCARSWNTIYHKGFAKSDELVCIQDDISVSNDFHSWITENGKKFDFIFGHAGDQFHYIKKSVLQKIGWWDERYLGCYCGDAEYLMRVWQEYDRDKISVEEYHGWGFVHNPIEIRNHVLTRGAGAAILDDNYENQDWALNSIFPCSGVPFSSNDTMTAARLHFKEKWGHDLLHGVPVTDTKYERKIREIDWYPWATKKYEITAYKDLF